MSHVRDLFLFWEPRSSSWARCCKLMKHFASVEKSEKKKKKSEKKKKMEQLDWGVASRVVHLFFVAFRTGLWRVPTPPAQTDGR